MTDPLRRTLVTAAPAALLAACAAPSSAPAPATATGSPPATAPGTPAAPRPWATDRPAFSIIDVDVRDGKGFGEYVVGHAPTIAAAGGAFLVAGATPRVVEGSWPQRRMVVHQWPTAQAFLDWYASPAYAPWKRMRHAAAQANVILVQGLVAAPAMPPSPPAFSLVDIEVSDMPAFLRYVQGHGASLQAGGGVFLSAGGRIEVIEGTWSPRRVVLHRWPDADAFRRWYDSAGYRPWRDVRHGASKANVVLLDGLSAAQKTQRALP